MGHGHGSMGTARQRPTGLRSRKIVCLDGSDSRRLFATRHCANPITVRMPSAFTARIEA
ncbi:hypothetical protein AZ78_4178 [Lysobacter capsici AZ78]|uniref:Uncharacterized protein n=1 Tax=Lysobacter capsici AZ78 TaxID=1444315 RepID=A0A125MNI0_9GAMM|nr:hypothetical protein AZ78_4178 [Lysobacter capsici AZ78]